MKKYLTRTYRGRRVAPASQDQRMKYEFPLRKDLTVEFLGFPRDLTVAEAERVAGFLKTLVQTELKGKR